MAYYLNNTNVFKDKLGDKYQECNRSMHRSQDSGFIFNKGDYLAFYNTSREEALKSRLTDAFRQRETIKPVTAVVEFSDDDSRRHVARLAFLWMHQDQVYVVTVDSTDGTVCNILSPEDHFKWSKKDAEHNHDVDSCTLSDLSETSKDQVSDGFKITYVKGLVESISKA